MRSEERVDGFPRASLFSAADSEASMKSHVRLPTDQKIVVGVQRPLLFSADVRTISTLLNGDVRRIKRKILRYACSYICILVLKTQDALYLQCPKLLTISLHFCGSAMGRARLYPKSGPRPS